MDNHKIIILFIIILLNFSFNSFGGQDNSLLNNFTTPPKGHLVIVGGGRIPSDIINKVISLSEKEKPLVVVFPQANKKNPISTGNYLRKYDVDVINTHNKNDDEIISLIIKSDIIYFGGGTQRFLIKTLRKKKILDQLFNAYHRGAVIFGTSAGAAVMSKVMILGKNDAWEKLYKEKSILSGTTKVVDGTGLTNKYIIDQHSIKRMRYARLISAVLEMPNLVGVGIDEGTSIVISNPDEFTVLGVSQVIIYDARKAKIDPVHEGSLNNVRNMKVHILTDGMIFKYDDNK